MLSVLLEPSTIGGEKIARGIMDIVVKYDFEKELCVVCPQK